MHVTTLPTAEARAAARTTERYREAAERGDVAAFVETLAPDVVVHSPITLRHVFRGREEVRQLMHSVFSTIEGMRFTDDVGDAEVRALTYRARIGGQEVQEATLVRLDEQARVRELVLWFRPMPGLAALMGALAPKLARRQGRGRARLVALLVAPLVLAIRFGDWLSVRLLKEALSARPPGR